jgi:pimeloyl-ACP methyl ester carboxylesterase
MRTPALALVAGAAVLAGVLAVPSSADAPPPHTSFSGCIASVPETDPLEAGPVKICYTAFKPGTASKDNKVPMVLHSHGWGGSRTTSLSSFKGYLDAGMGVVSFDQRGFGQSGGKAHVEDPAFEGEDVIALVDEVASFDWVRQNGKNDPVLGAIGGSYGGGYQFVGAFTELMKTGRTRFDALAPEITWWSLNESLAPRDVVRTTWTSALYVAGADAHTSTVHAGLAEGVATGNWPASMDEFFLDNGPAWHVAQGRQLDIPVLFGQGATDNLFPLDQGLKNFQGALTDTSRRNSIFVGYNGGHVLPNAVPAGFGGSKDACSAVVGKDASTLARQFLAENLLGADRRLTGHGGYHLTTAGDTCVSVASTEPTQSFDAGRIVTTAAAGAPQAIKLADGPLTVAGTPRLDATVTSLGLDSRAFFALSVGSSPANARVVQNNVLPHREASLNLGTARSIELPSGGVAVPAGQSLFLTVSPVSDMFVGHGSRTPSAMVLDGAKVRVPVVR